MMSRKLLHPSSLHIPHWDHPLLISDYGGKRVMGRSSRWNPTAEQVEALEEMYGRGTRTPSAQQIQEITEKLSKFGKIQGKNVFYWFQNHKARDRQKIKRHPHHHPTLSAGLSKRSRLETEHPLSNCITTSKCCESTREALDQDLQKKYSSDDDDVKAENAYPFVALNFNKMLGTKNDNLRDLGGGIKENKTLELFPIKSSSTTANDDDEDGWKCRFVPNQFFEFLPTKN